MAAAFAGVSALERAPRAGRHGAFLAMAALGAASGAVFALVALVAPAGKVGGVTGVVDAAGGLGGFAPPLVMGAIYGWEGNYKPGLALLAIVALGAALYTAVAMSSTGSEPAAIR